MAAPFERLDPVRTKVAIPRVDRRKDHERRDYDKVRIDKACTNCRKRKVRCSGEQPRCKNCDEQILDCVYPQARRDRLKIATDQNAKLVRLLKDLRLRADEVDVQKINHVLEPTLEEDVSTMGRSVNSTSLGKRARKDTGSEEEANGEAAVSGSVGSNEDLDIVDEDLLRSHDSQATGFVGQNSEVQWLRGLKSHMRDEASSHQLRHGPPGSGDEAARKRSDALHTRRGSSKLGNIVHVTDSSFYLDNDNLEVDVMVDQWELPPLETTERLFDCYMTTVYDSFPIIDQDFIDHFRRYCDAMRNHGRFEMANNWRANLNLALAIGARYSHLVRAEWRGDERDHLVYMIRAIRIIGLGTNSLITSNADKSLIQATGLLALYYMTIGHVSRSWVMIGISLRFALAVGLHLRNEDSTAPESKKEPLVRTWWALRSLECHISAISGRPCVIKSGDCSVPMPSVLPEENRSTTFSPENSATPSSTFASSKNTPFPASRPSLLISRIKADLITQDVLSLLYSPKTATGSWEQVQQSIPTLLDRLEQWSRSAFPTRGADELGSDSAFQREHLMLAFAYHSTKLLITRPCLCRIEQRIEGQSAHSNNFNQETAETCVLAAQALAELLPDIPDLSYIYKTGPWWSLVHYIMQAMAVFLLEMSHGAMHTSRRHDQLLVQVKKLIRWLRAMSEHNAVAGRAWKVVLDIMMTGTAQFQADLAEFLAEESHNYGGQAMAPYAQQINERRRISDDQEDPFSGMSWSAINDNPPNRPTFTAASSQLSPQPSTFDAYFTPNLGFQLPSVYGNPFVTNFDQPNPLSQNMEDFWGGDSFVNFRGEDDGQQ